MKCKLSKIRASVLSVVFITQFFIPLFLSAQTPTSVVTGIVKNAKNEPLNGVSVIIRNAKSNFTVGTNTDSAGVFTFRNVASGGPYNFSFSMVGYEPQTLSGYAIKPGATFSLAVEMKLAATSLNEVVVIGYGSQRKKDITSAITTVSVKDIATRPMINAVEAITGKASGVQVSVPSGTPGAALSVRVRGIGSPNGGEPLYVVDGVLANDLSAIDPNSIESISILKDASAAGIYGAAGSTNGVVIITTKRGTKGKAKTDANVYTGSQQIVKKLPVLNNTQWLALQTEINGAAPVIAPYYDLANTNNNWQDLIYHTALQTGVKQLA
jgi:TonB-dependent SusC/RagA subfamily outer membrane receptor